MQPDTEKPARSGPDSGSSALSDSIPVRPHRRRIVLAAAAWAAAAVFVYWYLASPGRQEIKKRPRTSVDDIDRPAPVGGPSPRNVTYPSVDENPAATRPGDEYDPLDPGAGLDGPRADRPVDVFALIPDDVSVVVALDLAQLKQAPWSGPIIAGNQFGLLASAAGLAGLDLRQAHRIAAALQIRSVLGMGLRNLLAGWSRWRRALKRPLCAAVVTGQSRAAALHMFRKHGPLRASFVMGHRVYQRDPGFSLAVPRQGLILATHHRPLASMLALATGRSTASIRSAEPAWLLPEIRELTEGEPAVLALSRMWNHRTGKPQPTKVPGGGKMLAAAFSARVEPKGIALRWLARLQSPKGAARLASRIKFYAKMLAQVSWIKRTRLARALPDLKINVTGRDVSAHLFLTHEVAASLLEFAARQ